MQRRVLISAAYWHIRCLVVPRAALHRHAPWGRPSGRHSASIQSITLEFRGGGLLRCVRGPGSRCP